MEIGSDTSSQASACCADRLALHSKVLEVEDQWLQQSKFEDEMRQFPWKHTSSGETVKGKAAKM